MTKEETKNYNVSRPKHIDSDFISHHKYIA